MIALTVYVTNYTFSICYFPFVHFGIVEILVNHIG